MNISEIKSFLGQDWTDAQDLLRESLDSDIALLNTTNEAILANGGKQLRPILGLLVARACGNGCTTRDSIRFAVAAELLHNATLLHDDVADSSKERRGQPTVMSLLGAPASVLIGDFWLVRAVDCILSADDNVNRVVRIFAKTLSDLAGGEMLQLEKAGRGDTDEEDYCRIIYSKTASLFEAVSVSCAVSVGACPEWLEAVRRYSVALGMAFQVRDDMFDYSEDAGRIGKPVGIDLDEQKITMPLLGALSSVSPGEAARIRSKVVSIHENPDLKEEIRAFVLANGGLEYSKARLNEYVAEAQSALVTIPQSLERELLAQIASFTASRDK
ncbi:MAG: polyprenyl synthetase family protein [Candidatus Cryptobacteroides sp.]